MTATAQQFLDANKGKMLYYGVSHECVILFYWFNKTVNKGEFYSVAVAADLLDYPWSTYDVIESDQEFQYMDWCVWSGETGAYQNPIPEFGRGAGHVAAWLADIDGERGYFFSQNPGPAQIMILEYAGIKGYLRMKGTAAVADFPYQLDLQYDTPNYTPPELVPIVWPGYTRDLEDINAIGIHWWNTPNLGDTYATTISTLTNPATQKSANAVITAGKAAILASWENATWSTGNPEGNAHCIAFECDPLQQDLTYLTIGALIAKVRADVGRDLPLRPHSYYTPTACPGTYDLARLDRIARAQIVTPRRYLIPGVPRILAPAA